MKYIKITILSFLSLAFSQCCSTKKMQENTPIKLESQSNIALGEVYCQSWVAGVRGGGSGVNVFIPVTAQLKGLKLDSLYFRGNIVALETKPNNPDLYIGRILTSGNQSEDYKPSTMDMPFKLNENEAIISFLDDGNKKYIQLSNIEEKKADYYPSTPSKKQ